MARRPHRFFLFYAGSSLIERTSQSVAVKKRSQVVDIQRKDKSEVNLADRTSWVAAQGGESNLCQSSDKDGIGVSGVICLLGLEQMKSHELVRGESLWLSRVEPSQNNLDQQVAVIHRASCCETVGLIICSASLCDCL
ncbi:hypothetical protein MN608_06141 [Microdochium nivale]|nr:hypothetical protein MN608_06141 [Microdochium nivale]